MAHDPVEPGASTLQGTLVADKYQILGAVASGGMGTVYRARHLHLDRDVAIKLMHARHFDNREYMARFRLEAQKAAGLEHPGIVEVRDFGEDAVLGPYLEMELLSGFSLRELLQAVGPLPIEVVVHCIAECLDALHYAHGKGILHRDLKPANLFVARVGDGFQTKILDFGLAKAILGDSSGAGHETLTKTGVVLGTLTYMSPEHFADFKSVDQRTDLYSLAASAYELLTGRPVVSGTSFIECVDKVSRGLHRQHPAELRPAVSPELDAVIARALRVDPRERFADAEAMRVALLACVRDPGEAQRTLRRLIVVEDALAKPRHRPTPSEQSDDALGFRMEATDDDPTVMGKPVFDDDDAPTTIAASPLELAGVTVLVSDSLKPGAPLPAPFSALDTPPASALETLPGRPLSPARRRGIPSTLWGAPIWFWAAALGLVIILVAIVLARRPAAQQPAITPPPAPPAQAGGATQAPGPLEGESPAAAHGTTPPAEDATDATAAGQSAQGDHPQGDVAPTNGSETVVARRTREARAPGDDTADSTTTAPAAGGATTLDINTIPAARVFLDGVDTGRRTPIRGLVVTPGRHVVELRVGDTSHRYPVVASPGESVRLFRVLPTD
ncbi:MAG: serine/threonine protein kinase [Sandaracinaceae bacterium]|nr:serine/threonine protein kinase [Sandaracinaceae bacterium]MBK8408382.1 serine/threonine protein kinase [Sandaracinaceae bacterium]